MQSEFLQNLLGVPCQFLVLFVGILRPRKLHELDFLKLMLPDDAADVFAIRPSLAAEARSVGGERDRQSRLVENLVAIEIRDRNFSRWDQPQIFIAVWHAERVG